MLLYSQALSSILITTIKLGSNYDGVAVASGVEVALGVAVAVAVAVAVGLSAALTVSVTVTVTAAPLDGVITTVA